MFFENMKTWPKKNVKNNNKRGKGGGQRRAQRGQRRGRGAAVARRRRRGRARQWHGSPGPVAVQGGGPVPRQGCLRGTLGQGAGKQSPSSPGSLMFLVLFSFKF